MNLKAGLALQNGKYILDQIIDQNELDITARATQVSLNQPIVLKTINPTPAIPRDTALLKQQFTAVARQFAQCHHPGLVSILDIFEQEGWPFVVMDYVAGQSLAQRVQAQGSLPEAQALDYIRQVGSALSLVHQHGLVHRHVAPCTMLQPPSAEFVVLGAYRIAYPLPPELTEAQAAEVLGAYAPIEEFYPQGRVTPAADVYSLAASLYCLVTGHPPIAAPLRNQAALVPPRQLQPLLSPAIEAAILSGLATEAQARPQTIEAWAALLPSNADPLRPDQTGNGIVPSLAQDGSAVDLHTYPLPSLSLTPTAAVASDGGPNLPPTAKGLMPKLVLMASVIAALIGTATGLALRVNGATGPGSTFFHTEQSFPPVDNWPGSEPIAAPTAPSVPEPPVVNREIDPEPIAPRIRSSHVRPAPPPVKEPEPVTPSPSPEASPLPSITPIEPEPQPSAVAPSPVSPPADPPASLPEPSPPTSVNPEPAPVKKLENGMQ